MRKLWMLTLIFTFGLVLSACQTKKTYETIDKDELVSLMEKKEDFILVVSRTWCGYCDQLKENLKDYKDDDKIYIVEFDIEFDDDGEAQVIFLDDIGLGVVLDEVYEVIVKQSPMFERSVVTPLIIGIENGEYNGELQIGTVKSSVVEKMLD